jgi:hypothetical protein
MQARQVAECKGIQVGPFELCAVDDGKSSSLGRGGCGSQFQEAGRAREA